MLYLPDSAAASDECSTESTAPPGPRSIDFHGGPAARPCQAGSTPAVDRWQAHRLPVRPVPRTDHHPAEDRNLTGVLLALTLALAGWVAIAFNRLVRLRNQMRAAWADIDVQLRRRHDLVPQLVAAVKAYAAHERGVLEAVTELRSTAMATTSPARLGDVESSLEQAITRLFALREAYPDLKSNENFGQLQRDLVDVEEQLQFARRFYNGAVRELNTTIQQFPDLLIARPFGFTEAEFFQASEDERAPVQVKLQ